VPPRPEDNEEERLARIAEIMRQNGIEHAELEAYMDSVRRRVDDAKAQAAKPWPTLTPPTRKDS